MDWSRNVLDNEVRRGVRRVCTLAHARIWTIFWCRALRRHWTTGFRRILKTPFWQTQFSRFEDFDPSIHDNARLKRKWCKTKGLKMPSRICGARGDFTRISCVMYECRFINKHIKALAASCRTFSPRTFFAANAVQALEHWVQILLQRLQIVSMHCFSQWDDITLFVSSLAALLLYA